MIQIKAKEPLKIKLFFEPDKIGTFNAFSTDTDICEVSLVEQLTDNAFMFTLLPNPEAEGVAVIYAEAIEDGKDDTLRWALPVNTLPDKQDARAEIYKIDRDEITYMSKDGKFTTRSGSTLQISQEEMTLLKEVQLMREYQKAFFAEPDKEKRRTHLINSKTSEKKVDQLLSYIMSEVAIEQ